MAPDYGEEGACSGGPSVLPLDPDPTLIPNP